MSMHPAAGAAAKPTASQLPGTEGPIGWPGPERDDDRGIGWPGGLPGSPGSGVAAADTGR
jgi:hypothetical protein